MRNSPVGPKGDKEGYIGSCAQEQIKQFDRLWSKILRCRPPYTSIITGMRDLAETHIIPSKNEPLFKLLTTALKEDKRVHVRQAAAYVLGHLDPLEAPVVSALTKALEDSDSRVAQIAADALGIRGEVMGPEAKEVAILALIEAWKNERAKSALIEAWKDERANVRQAIVNALGDMGQEAVPVLIEALGDRSWIVCDTAAKSLFCLDEERKLNQNVKLKVIDTLNELLESRRDNGLEFKSTWTECLRALQRPYLDIWTLGQESKN